MPVKPPESLMLGVTAIDGLRLGPAQATRASGDPQLTEAALIEAVQRGEAGSREALYHRFKRRVYALALRIVGAMDAEEVAQEAFIRIFRGLPKFRGDAALSTWIYRLAVNAALSHRARRAPAGAEARTAEGEPAGEQQYGDGHAGVEPPAGDAVLRTRLERALERLPAGYRTVVVLHDVEGLEHEEVAADPRLPHRHLEVAAAQGAGPAARDPGRRRHHRRGAQGGRLNVACPASERLSALLDGDLPPAESESLRAHGAGCARCTAALAELGALVSAARGLDSPEPPPTLWMGVEGSLARADSPGWWSWSAWSSWRPFAAGALVGAAALALLLAALPGVRRPPAGAPLLAPVPVAAAPTAFDPLLEEAETEFARAAASYERSIEKLRTLLAREEKGWSPDERARIADRLAGLDDVIARSRELAHQTPGDSAGNEQLFAAYQQRIAFLAAAVHRGGAWSDRRP